MNTAINYVNSLVILKRIFVVCAFDNLKKRRFWYEYEENMASYGTTNNPFGSDEPDKIQEARKQVL